MRKFFLYFENKKQLIEINRQYIIGRDETCDIVLSDNKVSRSHARLECADGFFLLTDLQSSNGTWYEGEKINEVKIREGASFRLASSNLSIRSGDHDVMADDSSNDTMIFEKKIAGILGKVGDDSLAEDISDLKNIYNKKKEKLSSLAFRDTLTGLNNRRFFDDKLNEEINRAIRYKRPLSLIMVDIDHFKKFNDNYGHQKGDEVLAVVSDILKKSIRSMDYICRYGGEEIAIILPETEITAAERVAETCREKVEKLSVKKAAVSVTVSLGVSSVTDMVKTYEKIISSADQALYKAKESGRNKVISASL